MLNKQNPSKGEEMKNYFPVSPSFAGFLKRMK